LLKIFDADEDEVLSLAEVLAGAPMVKESQIPAAATWSKSADDTPDIVITLEPGKPVAASLAGKKIKIRADEIEYSGGVLRISAPSSTLDARLKSVREFYLAPVERAAADGFPLTAEAIKNDVSLEHLGSFATYA